jgi:vitamin B12 transporter
VTKIDRIRNRALLGCAAGALIAVVAPAVAQSDGGVETVVVTGTRIGSVRADLQGSSLTVLTNQDLEVRQVQIVSDVLRDIPGVEVNRTGPVGGLTQVRMRGGEGNHTLVLIDGIKASDPNAGEFDFATLIADDVAKVEVLRGQQSALYGSDAIGGVINYITASGADVSGIRGRVEGGSFGTAQAAARAGGVIDGFDYALSGSYYRTDGTPDSPTGHRNLNAENKTFAGKFGYTVGGDLKLKAVVRLNNTDGDLDDSDYLTGLQIDSNGSYRNQNMYGLVSAEYALLDGHWNNSLTLQGVNGGRNYYGGYGLGADDFSYGSRGQREKLSYVTAYDFGSSVWAHKLTGAVDLEREYYRNLSSYSPDTTHHTDNVGLVGEYSLIYDNRAAFSAAVRRDLNYRFQSDTTYRIQGSYKFDSGTRLHAAMGSGVKSPGMNELYGSSVTFHGNPDLKPEKSEGYEVGVEQNFFDGLAVADVTFFNNQLHDKIEYIYTTSININGPTPQRGIEASLAVKLDESWSADIAYTYLHSRDDGQATVRRAANVGSVNLNWVSPDKAFGANLTLRYNGEQYDTNWATYSNVKLKSFTLLNLGGYWQINDTFQLYGRIENLTDATYSEVYGYRTPGRAAYAGLRIGF